MPGKNFALYSNMDNLDVAKLSETAGSAAWPKGKRYTVNLDGKDFTIQTYFSKAASNQPSGGYDAYSAINSMCARQLRDDEIRWETDGGPQFAAPEFNRKELKRLDSDQLKKRIDFTIAIANLINNQQTMEALVNAAAKKKNGALYKGRVLKIACSGVSNYHDGVYAIVGRAKSDDTISVTFESVMCKPGDNDVWANDFVSTYHEGLPVSEALKSILG